MIVLAIETATVEVGAALVSADGVLSESRSPCRRRHAEMLHPAVASVCTAAGVELAELDAVTVDVGPGLFTGLHVGVAAAKAFGFALGIPLVAVRSTEALRRGTRSDPRAAGRVVVPVVDMRRGELAWELPDGSLEIGPPSALAERLAALADDVLLVGDGARDGAALGGDGPRHRAQLRRRLPGGPAGRRPRGDRGRTGRGGCDNRRRGDRTLLPASGRRDGELRDARRFDPPGGRA